VCPVERVPEDRGEEDWGQDDEACYLCNVQPGYISILPSVLATETWVQTDCLWVGSPGPRGGNGLSFKICDSHGEGEKEEVREKDEQKQAW
jgi:hypothetical protein